MLGSTRWALLVCVLVVALGCASVNEDEPSGKTGPKAASGPRLTLGSDVWPPFTDEAPHPRVALELVHTALGRTGVRAASRIEKDFGRITDEIEAGELDGSAAIWRSPEREKYMLYSRPYLENRLVLVGRKGNDVATRDLSVLAGRRVGIVGSYAYGPVVENASGPVFVAGASDAVNLRRLLEGQLDYVIADAFLVHHLLSWYPERSAGKLEVGETPLLTRSLHFAVRRDLDGAKEIVERFDREIRTMMADGSYHRILGIEWIRADVDGDGRQELVLGGARAGVRPPSSSYDLFAATAPGAADRSSPRYTVDGVTYESWNEIPGRYRTPNQPRQEGGLKLFELDF